MQKDSHHYGLCALSIIPVRASADQASEQVSQLLYGDLYKITDHRKEWYKIRITFDGTEGWILKNQINPLSKEEYKAHRGIKDPAHASDLISFVSVNTNELIPVLLGSVIEHSETFNHQYEGASVSGNQEKTQLIETALQYLNAPCQWGGKTPFGIDCSGFTQMVYKINGRKLPRNAHEQAKEGEVLSFVEESTPGDLAFFDDQEGVIKHVGIIMNNNHIIHAFGKVRIDRLDQTGIYDPELGAYTHRLRVIKKII
ncbi:C40 family peptidase [Muriicola soli]|uniref:Hydrolase Nlp/P60 n=1 Tax=Muriicola soli TaxID=2507538 RepID=A0A411E7W9_9FLAO|nr:C40 family peptidase [Muriicola soli]QBA63806.1 hydrolase Nlp/P60 [Muriicola soli]